MSDYFTKHFANLIHIVLLHKAFWKYIQGLWYTELHWLNWITTTLTAFPNSYKSQAYNAFYIALPLAVLGFPDQYDCEVSFQQMEILINLLSSFLFLFNNTMTLSIHYCRGYVLDSWHSYHFRNIVGTSNTAGALCFDSCFFSYPHK